MWFMLKTILKSNDNKQTSWDNLILNFEGHYKPRNCLNNVTFTLFKKKRNKWIWFRLETILNINDN